MAAVRFIVRIDRTDCANECHQDAPLQLHTFKFDETFTSLLGLGSPVNLSSWYDTTVVIRHMTFVTGSEELLFVDDSARARMFSLITQQFRCVR